MATAATTITFFPYLEAMAQDDQDAMDINDDDAESELQRSFQHIKKALYDELKQEKLQNQLLQTKIQELERRQKKRKKNGHERGKEKSNGMMNGDHGDGDPSSSSSSNMNEDILNQLSMMEEELSQMRREKEQNAEDLRIAQNERDGMKGQLAIALDSKINLNEQNELLKDEIDNLKRKLQEVQEELQQYQIEKCTLSDTVAHLRVENNRLSDETESLKSQLNHSSNKIKSGTKSLQTLAKEVMSLREQKQQLSDMISSQKVSISMLTEKCNENKMLSIDHHELNRQFDELKMENDRLKKENDDLQCRVILFEEESEKSEIEEKIHGLLDHFTHLKRTLDNLRLEKLRSTTPVDSDLQRIAASNRNINLLLPVICTTMRGRRALSEWRKTQSNGVFVGGIVDQDENVEAIDGLNHSLANDDEDDDDERRRRRDETTQRLEHVLEELLVSNASMQLLVNRCFAQIGSLRKAKRRH